MLPVDIKVVLLRISLEIMAASRILIMSNGTIARAEILSPRREFKSLPAYQTPVWSMLIQTRVRAASHVRKNFNEERNL